MCLTAADGGLARETVPHFDSASAWSDQKEEQEDNGECEPWLSWKSLAALPPGRTSKKKLRVMVNVSLAAVRSFSVCGFSVRGFIVRGIPGSPYRRL